MHPILAGSFVESVGIQIHGGIKSLFVCSNSKRYAVPIAHIGSPKKKPLISIIYLTNL